ncbi:uncharacterized protein LOC134684814 [Mytilus trossulus]|uniref:uncharacterized protein LOC134684814 n=1 Tax=Mytilus trossulus TaxID=6551 RepID=UPI003007A59B
MNDTVIAIVGIDEDRFIRIQKLMGAATDALRQKFDERHPPKTLEETLKFYKKGIMKNINRTDQEKLYPKSGHHVPSAEMDLTLLVRVLRNTEIEEPLFGFDCKPLDGEISFGADVVRLNFFRNELNHSIVRKLNKQQFESMSNTLKEVIHRLCKSGSDDHIRLILTESLDYRAGEITWHLQKTKDLVLVAFKKKVIQPTWVSVIQLNDQQPLHYLIGGGTLLAYIMQNISAFSSREELTTYLRHVQNLTVKQCIFILNKLAELNLYQTKQDNSRNDLTPGDRRTEGHATCSGSHSTLNLDLQEICLQCGNVKNTSKYFSMPIPMGDDGLRNIPRFCECQKQVYDKHFKQYISTHSNTEIKPCNSPCLLDTESSSKIQDLAAAQAYKEQFPRTATLKSSRANTSKYFSMPIPMGDDGLRNIPRFCECQKQVYDKHFKQYISTHSNTEIKPCNSPCLLDTESSKIQDLAAAQAYKEQPNNHHNANVTHVSKLCSNKNVYGLTQPASDNGPFIRKKSDGHNEFCGLEVYLRSILILCNLEVVMVVSFKVLHPIFKEIFQSQEYATIATLIFDLLCLVLMIFFSME